MDPHATDNGPPYFKYERDYVQGKPMADQARDLVDVQVAHGVELSTLLDEANAGMEKHEKFTSIWVFYADIACEIKARLGEQAKKDEQEAQEAEAAEDEPEST